MKFINLVVALILFAVISQSVFGITAKVGEPKIILRPSFDEAGITINRVLTVINDNPYEVMVQVIKGEDAHDLIKFETDRVYLEPNETREMPFTINLKYGGQYQRKVIASFSPVNASAGSQSLGMVSNMFIYAEGPEAPEGYFDTPTTIVETPSSNSTLDDTTVVNTTTPQVTHEVKKANGSIWIGILTLAIVLFIGGLALLIVWKLGLLK